MIRQDERTRSRRYLEAVLQQYAVPGPDLPLLEYYHPNYRLDEIDVFEMSRGLYRAAIRCYAARLYPLEVVSVDRWEFARSQMYEPVLFRFVAAKCARIRDGRRGRPHSGHGGV
jgi:hypothetical protein